MDNAPHSALTPLLLCLSSELICLEEEYSHDNLEVLGILLVGVSNLVTDSEFWFLQALHDSDLQIH